MVNVTVVGASGYLGGELLRILVNHPKVGEIRAVSRRLAGKKVSSLHKNLLNVFDDEFIDLDLEKIDTDIAFFAAPPGDWFRELPGILDKGVKAITLGGKFRIKDAEIDKKVYGGYENAKLLKERVYGMPELYRKEIKKARLVTNPGCYATSVILGIAPLAKHSKHVDLDKVVVTSISGSSGAGATPSEKMHHPELSGNVRPYNISFHRHVPEMESILSESFGKLKLSFVPLVGDYKRGIVSSITLFTGKENDYAGEYRTFYKNEPFVRVTEDVPDAAGVSGSNFCDVHAEYDKESSRLLVISAIDNLIKGGSGQAVQNMNLMTGLDEKTGLDLVGGHP